MNKGKLILIKENASSLASEVHDLTINHGIACVGLEQIRKLAECSGDARNKIAGIRNIVDTWNRRFKGEAK